MTKCWHCYKKIKKEDKKKRVNGYLLHKSCATKKVVNFLNSIKIQKIW